MKTKELFSKPNQITFIRILLIPIFVIFLLMDLPYKDYIAAFIFIVLSLSDALDGYIARKHRQITKIGKLIDPIADKLLIAAALIFLIGRIQLWMAVIIISRELIITVARILFLPKKVVIPASMLGKIKTIVQIIAIVAVILNMPFNWWLMLAAVIITIVSGLDYLVKMGRILGEDVFNLSNVITTFRLLLIPFFIISLVGQNKNFALAIFTLIVLSDKLDGISARIMAQITKFGRIYDSFTDFILVISSVLAFYITGVLEFLWMAIYIIPVLFLVITKLAYFSKYNEVSSSPMGKILIGFSYVVIGALIISFPYKFYMLISLAVIAYAYMAVDTYKMLASRKPKSS